MSDMFQLLRESNEITDQAIVTPLTGGVSSDIVLVEDQGQKWVAKRALEKLKVAADWRADTNRYISEYRFLQTVSQWLPAAVPKIRSVGKGYFTMEYLGSGYENWKQLMLSEKVEEKWGAKAGEIMGTIHAKSWGQASIQELFETTANFESLRIEPYLRYTGTKHPALQSQFDEMAEFVKNNRCALVHGDFSPKNILVKNEQMVVLDCEVAWYGAPSFDTAFFTNHLILKAIHQPKQAKQYAITIQFFWEAYQKAIGKTKSELIQKQTARLQWFLMLARVDGKSPVEYLAHSEKEKIRTLTNKYLTPSFQPTFEQTFNLLFPK
jgi:aminoglycoside phosphotransferase (APT) family kinase protein